MIYSTISRIKWNNLLNLKACKNNCICKDRMKRLLVKIPLNIIDETFIIFQIREQKKEYDKCYSSKKIKE